MDEFRKLVTEVISANRRDSFIASMYSKRGKFKKYYVYDLSKDGMIITKLPQKLNKFIEKELAANHFVV